MTNDVHMEMNAVSDNPWMESRANQTAPPPEVQNGHHARQTSPPKKVGATQNVAKRESSKPTQVQPPRTANQKSDHVIAG